MAVSQHTDLKALTTQFRRAMGLLVRPIPLTVLRNAWLNASQRKGTDKQKQVAAAIRAELDSQMEHSVCHTSLLGSTFLDWAFKVGMARKDPSIAIGYAMEWPSTGPVWRAVAVSSWGTLRLSSKPATGAADNGPYDDNISFVAGEGDQEGGAGRKKKKGKKTAAAAATVGNRNDNVPKVAIAAEHRQQLQEWADQGRIAELDVMCAEGGKAKAVVDGSGARSGFGRMHLLHTLGDIAARKQAGRARYQAVVVSVSFDSQHTFKDSKMRALLEKLGFKHVEIFAAGSDQPAKDSSGAEKKYMIIHNAGQGDNQWWKRVGAKLTGLPAVCPSRTGSGIALCV